MEQKFLITISTGIAFLLILAFAVLLAVSLFAPKKPEIKSEQAVPVSEASKTSVAYGVKMQDKCFTQFQDFIKTYGQDFSKCLVNFNFSNEYCGGFDPETQGLSNANVIVILDSSGSMAEKIGPDAKIDIAKKAVSDFLNAMPKSINTGLVVYGHKGSNSPADKELSCKGIEEVVKLGQNNNSNIISAMSSFNPRGWTPIAGSIDFAKNIFLSKDKNDKNYLILVSDGAESCDGNALSAVSDLKSEIKDIKLSIIGFATNYETQDFLRNTATRGGGAYLTAADSTGMAKAFNDQLAMIKRDCVSATIFSLFSKYQTNNMNNLNCWLDAQKIELADFVANLDKKSADTECNSEVGAALIARHKDFWNKKDIIEQQDDAIYKQTDLMLFS